MKSGQIFKFGLGPLEAASLSDLRNGILHDRTFKWRSMSVKRLNMIGKKA
jgi:hypothetical protein